MEEGMVTLHNVMSVDLAIKREMAYRHKMEVLKNQPLNNLNPLLPSLVYPVSQPQPQPALSHPQPTWSQPQPTLSQPQQPTLQRKEACCSSGTKKLKRRSTGILCKICDITMCSVSQLKDHSSGARHKNGLQQLKKRGKNGSTPFLCQLCNKFCSSDIVMEDHLKGSKHVALFHQFENAKRARAEAEAARQHY